MELKSLQTRVGQPQWQAQQTQQSADNPRRDKAAEQINVPAVPNEREAQKQAQQWQAFETQYDMPSMASQKALAAYQGVAQNPQREQVQSMFGVDIYA
ncbi:hypothetical protein SAMN06297229_1696 [Pseudidiomarina planktonica]|uniref:Uncharacterized protein n=1 Tax=Pseudidiomarina planktonica TaxID=1323738 RepID=A0A1Y6F8K9_9GAMM|nr:hypothetical protein [Pseudidiomarina planktonica]RUO64972.1 hypothetical protein CWI77_00295 [Pseudidiomarina planktonica]SMQ68723.1 hypothetical protein SAMN06297229_1696 [Pseudidiomarina planktonica]